MRKLRSRRGETLVETLDVAVRYDGISEPASLTVSSGRGTSSFTVPVEKYTTENGYCYYTYDGN